MAEESTTPDLAERVRQAFEAWNCGDVDAAMCIYAPDAVLRGLGIVKGRSAIRAFMDDYAAIGRI